MTEEQITIYNEQILPLIKQIDAITTKYGISYIVVVQVSDRDFKLSLNIHRNASEQMKEGAKWWLQDTIMDSKI